MMFFDAVEEDTQDRYAVIVSPEEQKKEGKMGKRRKEELLLKMLTFLKIGELHQLKLLYQFCHNGVGQRKPMFG